MRKPKHLLPIVGDSPMLAQTVKRLSGLVPAEQVFVITNITTEVLESCPDLLPEWVIGEPQGRDTAAAVGLAACWWIRWTRCVCLAPGRSCDHWW